MQSAVSPRLMAAMTPSVNMAELGDQKSLDFCAVPNCHNYRNKYISLHRFPKDLELQNLWLRAVKLKTFSFASRVCSDHFLLKDFYLPGVTTMRRRLRSKIVPTKNLPSTYEYKKTACEPLIFRRKIYYQKKKIFKKSKERQIEGILINLIAKVDRATANQVKIKLDLIG
ncbi:hypothetical protein KQX54_000982 [Cotesia glomerata]|uniref:THAP-type domain-containing protein n=1 Tax=Cotesia glomerata TaxID=32391 RepID=A0AAV7HX83_COTGL|nr:hypothetical protein KQX54_000982 [Cotesia glomerata]